MKFVHREVRRGNRYDAVILDPPSYGHGPHGEVWRLAKHLPRLLELCGELTAGRRQFMLLTCHTPGFDPPRLRRDAAESPARRRAGPVAQPACVLRTADGPGVAQRRGRAMGRPLRTERAESGILTLTMP